MPKLRLSGRKAAVVGLCAAAATTALVAVAGPASAAPTQQLTSCTDTVQVRSQPSASAPVIGSCRSGERVTVDETRNGFAHLVNKQGWASVDFVDLKNTRSNSSPDDGLGGGELDNNDPDAPNDDNKKDEGGVLGGLGGGLGS